MEYKRFFASKFVNCIINGRAYSWPGMDPAAVINFDNSMAACNAKGAGWHMLSIAERAVINHLIHKSGFEPRGNTQYGKNHAYTYEVGEQSADEPAYEVSWQLPPTTGKRSPSLFSQKTPV